MKHSCEGCKALVEIGKLNCRCSLGYPVKMYEKDVSIGHRGAISVPAWRPTAACPKPRTYNALFQEMRNKGGDT